MSLVSERAEHLKHSLSSVVNPSNIDVFIELYVQCTIVQLSYVNICTLYIYAYTVPILYVFVGDRLRNSDTCDNVLIELCILLLLRLCENKF